ncbi:MAG: carboxylating nicotinate-nucleotide diphosphorylase [Thermoguttaceae bacterium]
MSKEFHQAVWSEELEQDWLRILALAVREDLGPLGDCTTEALVPEQAKGRAAVVVRQAGVLAGEAAVAATLAGFIASSASILPVSPRSAGPLSVWAGLEWLSQAHDGDALVPRKAIGILQGPVRAMLAVERPLLNMLGRLSGIASLTRRYVDAARGTRCGIYDTRKTTPGWRSLEKYAVRCGGGRNHRAGLFEAVLIKDNHLALGAELHPLGGGGYSPAEAVLKARQFLSERWGDAGRQMIVEIEVDTLEQLDEVLAAEPDIVLLDNMNPAELADAVARRDARNAAVELEASGGIDLDTVRAVAETGVERISVGALTHSAASLDFGLDWRAV